MKNYKKIETPMLNSYKLNKDKKNKSVNQNVYRNMICSLLYLTSSRPNILFSICMCARFQSDLRRSHLITIKKIVKYISMYSKLGL